MIDDTKTIGDYLTADDPLGVLWPDVLRTVFHDSPRAAHPERVSSAVRTYYFVGCFHGELVNGGMSQFFFKLGRQLLAGDARGAKRDWGDAQRGTSSEGDDYFPQQ